MPVNNYTLKPPSWTPEKDRLSSPLYLSLAAALERDIINGILPAGTQLPPQRELADFLDINFTTVTRAYNICRHKGLIYGITGRGSFVAQREPNHPTVLYDLGVVQGFPLLVDPLVSATKMVLGKSDLTTLFTYNDRLGLLRHRQIGQKWLHDFGVEAAVDNIAIFAGTQNALTVTLLALFNIGDVIATDYFTYANFIGAAQLAHLKLLPIAGDNEGMLPAALAEACLKQRICGLFIMPNQANPTTITMPQKRREELAAVCARNKLLIIEDDGSTLPQLGLQPFTSLLPEQAIYLSPATRYLAAGLRVTFVTFPKQLKEIITRALLHTSIKTSSLDAEILCELITSGNALKLLHSKRQLAIKANQLFDKIFPNLPLPPIPYGYFRILPLNGDNTAGPDLEQFLLQNGLKVYASYRFAVDKNRRGNFLRLSLSSAATRDELEKGLLKLKSLLGYCTAT